MLTQNNLKDLFAAYNNVNQNTVDDLVEYLFEGDMTADTLQVTTSVKTALLDQISSSGLKIGSAGSKLGFFNATPILKPTIDQVAVIDVPTARQAIDSIREALGSGAGGLGLSVIA